MIEIKTLKTSALEFAMEELIATEIGASPQADVYAFALYNLTFQTVQSTSNATENGANRITIDVRFGFQSVGVVHLRRQGDTFTVRHVAHTNGGNPKWQGRQLRRVLGCPFVAEDRWARSYCRRLPSAAA